MKLIKTSLQCLVIAFSAVSVVLLINAIYIELEMKRQPASVQPKIGDLIKLMSPNGAFGTGFVVEYNNRKNVVTAAHVCDTLRIGEFYKVQGGSTLHPFIIDEQNDVCILTIINGEYFKAFSVEETDNNFRGQLLEYAGYPNGNIIHTTGQFLYRYVLESIGDQKEFYATNMPTDFGASGSPVLMNNRLVGMIVSTFKETKQANFISINKVIMNLKRNN